jgi:hypothetical protein
MRQVRRGRVGRQHRLFGNFNRLRFLSLHFCLAGLRRRLLHPTGKERPRPFAHRLHQGTLAIPAEKEGQHGSGREDTDKQSGSTRHGRRSPKADREYSCSDIDRSSAGLRKFGRLPEQFSGPASPARHTGASAPLVTINVQDGLPRHRGHASGKWVAAGKRSAGRKAAIHRRPTLPKCFGARRP